jgi:hypothetical protein
LSGEAAPPSRTHEADVGGKNHLSLIDVFSFNQNKKGF